MTSQEALTTIAQTLLRMRGADSHKPSFAQITMATDEAANLLNARTYNARLGEQLEARLELLSCYVVGAQP